MCVEIVFFPVKYVHYNFMAAEILPKQRREIIVLGYGNYRAIALWRVETGCLENSDLENSDLRPQT